MSETRQRYFHWEILVSAMLVVGTILGVTIPLHLSLQQDMRAIQQEMKDFHGRLCAIEERNRGIYERAKE